MNFFDRRITGYKKLQQGLPCEDAVYVKALDSCVIMACADGHGDHRCKYASRGAELATRIIVSELEKCYKDSDSISDFGESLNDNRIILSQKIVYSWVGAVLDDYRINHQDDESFASRYKELRAYSRRIFELRDGAMPVREFRQLADYRYNCEEAICEITSLYGTTLNAVVVSNKFVFAIGIGDGDVVDVNGKRVEWLLPYSPQYSNATYSLSERFSIIIDNFSSVFVPITSGRRITDNRFMPEFVMIATDGLRNAFLSDAQFADKLIEIASLLKKGEGHSFVKNSKLWLEERSKFGVTQDDISFCLCTKHSLKKRKVAK